MLTTGPDPFTAAEGDLLLAAMSAIARDAGRRLLATFSAAARPDSRDAMLPAMRRNEAVVASCLRDALTTLRPAAAWWDDDDREPLPAGEWWVVDSVEGNVNHVHGLRDWGVTIALVREREPVAAVVHQPLDALTWTAVRGGGTCRDGAPVRVASKKRLDAAIATTGQAEAGQTETYAHIGDSVTAMLHHVLLVRMSVPSAFPLLQLAEGQGDVFWQYAPSLPGIAAGLLMATEAGGVASRLDGTPWRLGAPDILVSTPGLHRAAVDVLRAFALPQAA